MKPSAKASLHYLFFIPFVLLFSTNNSTLLAQVNAFWSTQERIPEYFDSTEEPPFMISDLNHTVHAFNSQPLELNTIDSPTVILYRQWTMEGGWTTPNDILFDPSGGIDLMGVTDDSMGNVHLIFQKNFGDIYYTRAFLSDASTAAGWTTPIFIADQSSHIRQGLLYFASIASDKTGENLVVIYGGAQDGSGLYFTNSSDHGESWSDPYPIFLNSNEDLIVTSPKLYYGESGVLHATWAVTLSSGFGENGYYANLVPGSSEWSEPVVLDDSGFQVPSIIEHEGDVFVGYYHGNVNGNWWRRSSDGGKTWTSPSQFSSNLVGTNGAISFAVDSKKVLHAFFGERTDGNIHGMWHFVWDGATWSKPEAVISGPQIRDVTGGDGFDPRSARAVIVNGNIALVTWGTDGFAGTNGAWYSYKRLDAPELPDFIFDTPTPMPRLTSTSVAPSFPSASPVPTVGYEGNLFQDSPEFGQNPQVSIFVGVIPVLLLVVGIIVIFFVFSRQK